MRNFGRDRRDSRKDDKKMYRAVCAECDRNCEVPFKPSGDKPVLCSACFKKEDGGRGDDRGRGRGNDRGRGGDRGRGRDNDRGRGGDRGKPRMYEAVCAECGRDCEVPFQPSGDKPVLCSACFGRSGGSSSSSKSDNSGKKWEEVNQKLDQILLLLKPNLKPIKSELKPEKKKAKKASKKKAK